ncbi:MazG-like family protein [uncultured Anaerococcus sp.]|uniref:MazG-like family protein n=1 Tax=uncultured Anaerococcus sp. TaxID=293428 RepID=UPI00261CF6BF|nr:MazG-like family protein [uncultured Anaerococcus sp.]
MTYEELQEKVLEWADEKDLLHEENADKQFIKFIEEVFEFKTEMNNILEVRPQYNDSRDIHYFEYEAMEKCLELEFGDILVTLIILAQQLDLDPVECLELAYNKIKDRQGKTINGTFVKEEDL